MLVKGATDDNFTGNAQDIISLYAFGYDYTKFTTRYMYARGEQPTFCRFFLFFFLHIFICWYPFYSFPKFWWNWIMKTEKKRQGVFANKNHNSACKEGVHVSHISIPALGIWYWSEYGKLAIGMLVWLTRQSVIPNQTKVTFIFSYAHIPDNIWSPASSKGVCVKHTNASPEKLLYRAWQNVPWCVDKIIPSHIINCNSHNQTKFVFNLYKRSYCMPDLS